MDVKHWFPAVCLAAACACGAATLSAVAPLPTKSGTAAHTGPVLYYTGCLERVSRDHSAFILANMTRDAPDRPPKPYDVLSSQTFRLEPDTSAVDFGSWEGYVVEVTGTLVPRAPVATNPAYKAPGARRFARLPLFDVTSFRHIPGTQTCPA